MQLQTGVAEVYDANCNCAPPILMALLSHHLSVEISVCLISIKEHQSERSLLAVLKTKTEISPSLEKSKSESDLLHSFSGEITSQGTP